MGGDSVLGKNGRKKDGEKCPDLGKRVDNTCKSHKEKDWWICLYGNVNLGYQKDLKQIKRKIGVTYITKDLDKAYMVYIKKRLIFKIYKGINQSEKDNPIEKWATI